MEENLRVAKKREEILKIFEDAVAQKTEVILWQKIKNERKMMLAEIKFIDKDEGTVLLKSLNNAAFSFDEEASLQVKSDYRNIMFKGLIQLSKGGLIIIQIPDEIHVLDHREQQRKRVPLLGDHNLTLEQGGETVGNLSSFPLEMDLKILDITKDGASVLVENDQMEKLEEKKAVFITAISSIMLPLKAEGEIVYFVPMGEDRPSQYRMGLKFKKKLSDAILSILHKS